MPKVSKIFPVFAVSNLDAAVAYYQDKLGFALAWTWGQPSTRAGVAFGDVEIHLDSGGAGAPSGTSVVYCHMTDVEAYFLACASRDADIAMVLGQRPWGWVDFRAVDPDGNRVVFGEEQ
jgi:catechol 2,3-dioxygenase-like lactoylglutathione lyase family enzyme